MIPGNVYNIFSTWNFFIFQILKRLKILFRIIIKHTLSIFGSRPQANMLESQKKILKSYALYKASRGAWETCIMLTTEHFKVLCVWSYILTNLIILIKLLCLGMVGEARSKAGFDWAIGGTSPAKIQTRKGLARLYQNTTLISEWVLRIWNLQNSFK